MGSVGLVSSALCVSAFDEKTGNGNRTSLGLPESLVYHDCCVVGSASRRPRAVLHHALCDAHRGNLGHVRMASKEGDGQRET